MITDLIFAPLIPLPLLWALAAGALIVTVLALRRGLAGWWLRALLLCALIAALTHPSIQEQERKALPDIVIALIDESASQTLGERPAQTQAALRHMREQIASLGNTELREIRVGDGANDSGTRMMHALRTALNAVPSAQIAGVFMISDGQVHDVDLAPELDVPLHLLLTGQSTDWDRRIIITNAPAFAIIGEPTTITLRVEDDGAAPQKQGSVAQLSLTLDTDAPQIITVPIGQDLEFPITLTHGGESVLTLSVAEHETELTAQNNRATLNITGVRDRLRVLLVSGEPHAGQRVWRDLLKSDPNVDLVHFTILRPPQAQDATPTSQLALIPFPTERLFGEAIDDFDLVIFDRYRLRGFLPDSYMKNVVRYTENGGTVLVVAGPEFGSAESLWHSSLFNILPADPTARVIERGFTPALTDTGRRHPVTEGLEALAGPNGWGRWFRMVEVIPRAGDVVMEGPAGRPLLILNRVGKGRVAILASDQAWLWGRGFEGGGPQLDLLRRLAHWMLKEPELEEERLDVEVSGMDVTVLRRSLEESPDPHLQISQAMSNAQNDPSAEGSQEASPDMITMQPNGPGRLRTTWRAPHPGVYRLDQGALSRLISVGTPTPREFAQTLANPLLLMPLITQQRGGVMRIEDDLPNIRTQSSGRRAAGRGWLGITPRGATLGLNLHITALFRPEFWAILTLFLAVGAWLIESRRRR